MLAKTSGGRRAWASVLGLVFLAGAVPLAGAAVTELNSSGGTSATNGLHIYIEDTTKMQVRRLNNTGQVYLPSAVPPSNSLDNGIFLRANGTIYGPRHTVSTFNTATAFPISSISAASPANPIANGITQTAVGVYGVSSGPLLTIEYKYLRPYDFVTLTVTLDIPAGYPVSAANPVRYYHAIDTYLGGSDNGCGVTFVDSNGRRVVGTYPPASGTTCPSSSSIPSGVSIIESFRERSGQNFTRYCTARWSDFWDITSPYANCAVYNPSQWTNSVTTTYQDTGVGIEYDFTATGTYVFSYDFVIGSPAVPPYDHLELRYDPGGALCPFTVTVLGCTSSTVPCPAGSELNANLSGTLTASSSGSVALTPSSGAFSIAAGTPTATLTAQESTAGATVTLGASGLSTAPLNGVRCWNGSSETCSFTAPSVSCFASDLEACSNLVGSPARCGTSGNRLYTKVVGQAMSFDLVALKDTPKVVDTAFNSGATTPVDVDLVSSAGTTVDGTTRCPTGGTALPAVMLQKVFFTAGRPASATTYTVPAGENVLAQRNVWVRFNQGAGGILCSSDRFAIRPAAFTSVTSPDANADAGGTNAAATPILRAGSTAFTLTANSATPGYDGTPGIDSSLLEWLSAPSATGSLSGSFTTAASAASGNGASGSAFFYDEVGYFRIKAKGVVDSAFTASYQDGSDTVCVNTAPNDFLNTADSSGKVGCKFGNTAASAYFGRFVPDHFDTAVTQACAAGGFTYAAQPFTVGITARNAAGATTLNYHGAAAFAKATTLSAWDAAGSAANPGPGALVGTAVAAAAFTNGVASVATPAYAFSNPATVATAVRVRAVDGDGVTSLRSLLAVSVEGAAQVNSGRLVIGNAYGNEFLPLPVRSELQVWTAAGWQRHGADTCTAAVTPTAANGGLVFATQTPLNQLAAGETTASLASPVLSGNLGLRLSAPGAGNFGYVDIAGSVLRGANTWLLLAAPSSRVCFGKCGPRAALIYSRERY
jgi:hypothetical protein